MKWRLSAQTWSFSLLNAIRISKVPLHYLNRKILYSTARTAVMMKNYLFLDWTTDLFLLIWYLFLWTKKQNYIFIFFYFYISMLVCTTNSLFLYLSFRSLLFFSLHLSLSKSHTKSLWFYVSVKPWQTQLMIKFVINHQLMDPYYPQSHVHSSTHFM